MDFRSGNKSAAGEDDVEINLTPMIDCVFLLLIFFATSTTFVENPGITVDLPKSVSQDAPSNKKNIVISVNEDGKTFVDQVIVSSPRLREILLDRAKEDPDRVVILNADERAPHGAVVEVMDLAKQVGLVHISISTLAKPQKGK